MSLISRYIFKKLIGSFLVIGPVVVLIVWLTVSVRYVNIIISDDVDLWTFFKVLVCALPDILIMIIPICFLVSSLHVFHKMRLDQEITVCMTSGRSSFALARPLLLLGSLLSFFLFEVQTEINPRAYEQMAIIQKYIQNKISLNILKPGVFNIVGNSVVYIGSKTNSDLNDIFISYVPSKTKKINIITSKRGSYQIDHNKLFVTLEKGLRQVLDEKNNIVSTFQFEEFSYEVTEFVQRYSSSQNKLHGEFQRNLFRKAREAPTENLKAQYLAEAFGRYLISFSTLIIALLLAIFLIRATHRSHSFKNLAYSFSLSLSSQIGLMCLVSISRKNPQSIPFEFILVFCVIAGLFVRLAYGKGRS